MTAVVYRTRGTAFSVAVAHVEETLRRLARALAQSWRYAAARRAFEQLDDRAVRDLGMRRSEFDSFWAEAHGYADCTRLRVQRHLTVWL